MDTTTTSTYNYPQLFDIQQDDTTATQFDTNLFHGLNLSGNGTPPQHTMYNNNTFIDKKLSNNNTNAEDIYTTLTATNNSYSYLQYLQSNTSNNNNDYFYDIAASAAAQHQMMMLNIPPTMDLADYDYFNNNGLSQQPMSDQKQQYNWLYDPTDTFLPNSTAIHPHHQQQQQQQNFFGDDTFVHQMMNQQHLDSIMSDHMSENITVEGGMSRGYVSLSDVNSFVAKADSMKHSCLLHVPNDIMADFSSIAQQQAHQHFSSSESTSNDDSEDDYSDNETELRWPMLNTSYSTPTSITTKSNATTKQQQKLMIKIKKPSSSSSTNLNVSALPSPYGEHKWGDLVSLKTSKSANTSSSAYKTKYRKSMSNIFNNSTTTATNKKKNRLLDNSKRRGSAPHRLTINHSNHSTSSLGSLHSSSSLSSLSNNLQKSMRVSDSMNSFLSVATRHSSDEEDAGEDDEEDIEEDEDDDEYQIKSGANASSGSSGGPNQLVTKKGRNVDKACNHCKRSHLRCDDMRPCRRCVATGKTGCKDVQHKPRGRPKLHKK